MRRILMAILAAGGVAVATSAQAQDRGSLELRGGAAFPVRDLDQSTLNPGGGFGLTAGLRVMPHVFVYGGWDWFRRTTDDPFAGKHLGVENTGYAFGLKFQHPTVMGVDGWLRGGGLYNHIELENSAGDIIADSGHELGWEVGVGASIPIATRLALTPGVRYRTFSGEVDAGTGPVEFDLSYVAAEVGLAWSFGGRSAYAARR